MRIKKSAICMFLLSILVMSSLPGKAVGLDLLECYEMARTHDPQYLAVFHDYKAQQTLPKQSKAQLLPQIQGSFSSTMYNFSEGPATYQDYRGDRIGVNLRQPLFNAWKYFDLNQNTYRAAAAEYKLADSRNNLILRVAEAYFKHLHALEQLKILEDENKTANETMHNIKLLFDAGEATLIDVHDGEAKKAEIEFKLIEGQNQVVSTGQELERIVGNPVDGVSLLSGEFDVTKPDPDDVSYWSDSVKQDNPVVRYYALSQEIAKEEIKKQRSQHLPTLDLTGGFSQSNTNDYLRTDKTTYYSGGIQLSMPLWTSGYIAHKVVESKERSSQAQREYEKALSDAQQNMRHAFLGMYSSLSKVKSAQAFVKASDAALASTRIGYRSGIRTIVDVLSASSHAYRAKGDLLQVKIDYLMEKLKLHYWSGRISENVLAEINVYLIGNAQ